MNIITWNINSVRLRLQLVLDLLADQRPDKCPDEHFPHEAFEAAGYTHRAIRGEKGYNGVAILSRQPLHDIRHLNWAGKDDCRHIAATLDDGTHIHNFYIPAGGDIADVEANEKFAHKMRFLDELTTWSRDQSAAPSVLVGDLNIAPREDDVWGHKQLLKVVSHTPIETDALNSIMAAGGWTDAVRAMIPEGLLYSWWSYRARDWDAADKGRRLDHIWVTAPLAGRVKAATVLREARGWEKPSDHAPVVVTLD
ncbi:MAG: endonuclease/exonuclease/phosphatase family protein [Alphaproteobacteria bacterium]|nr:endonuclease/exonuclease/phosphatase family protein [Alphaproteobacteria bacterium]